MGSLFGGLLAAKDRDIVLVDRNEDHVTALSEDGLRLQRMDGAVDSIDVTATTDPADVQPVDVLIVFVKSHETAEAMGTAEPLLSSRPTVLTVQNGLGNPETIAEFVPKSDIIAGTTTMGAVLLGPGRVRQAGAGATKIGRYFGSNDDRVDRVAAALRSADIETTVVDDVNAAIWEKVLINVGINAPSALASVRNGQLAETEAGRHVLERAISEAIAVARAEGVTLEDSVVESAMAVAKDTASNHSSMRQDIEANRVTEIDALNGAITQRAQSHDIDVPVNETLTRLIQLAEAGFDD